MNIIVKSRLAEMTLAFLTLLGGIAVTACGGANGSRGSGDGGAGPDGSGSGDGGAGPASSGDYGKSCSNSSECSGNICIFQTGGGGVGSCTYICGATSDCPANTVCEPTDNGGSTTVCVAKTTCTRYASDDESCQIGNPNYPTAFHCPDKQQPPPGCSEGGGDPQLWCCPAPDAGTSPCARNNEKDLFCPDPTQGKAYVCPASADPLPSQKCTNQASLNVFCCAN
ncbi:MAG: hypothetical protein ACHREM_05860 [Polyangiales bacterium]